MRRLFGKLLVEEMKHNPDIYLLCGDVGFGVLDEAFRLYPDRTFNMGASEQAMIGAAVGLTYENKIPICYTITPFLLYRPYEWLRNYVQEEGAPIKLVGSGRNDEYGDAGYTHWCKDQYHFLELLPIIRSYFPETKDNLAELWDTFMLPGPSYLNLKR